MGEETMTQFRVEGEKAFPTENKEGDDPSESSPENNATDPTQSQEGQENSGADTPGGKDAELHKNPRWAEREKDWTGRFNAQEQRHTDELQKIREEFDAKFSSIPPKGTPATPQEIPAWFGGDEQAWNEFVKYNETLLTQAEERAYKKLTSAQQEEQKRIQDATDYFQKEVSALESDKTLNPKGEKVDRNKLLKTALDNDLVDSQGRWNYKAAWSLIRQQGPTNTQDRKNLAGATTGDRRAETKPSNVTTSQDFKNPSNRPW